MGNYMLQFKEMKDIILSDSRVSHWRTPKFIEKMVDFCARHINKKPPLKFIDNCFMDAIVEFN